MPTHHPVVGSWSIAVDVPGAVPGLRNLARLSLDGGVVVVVPSPTAAPPAASHRQEFWTPALGSWTAANERQASLTFLTLGVDEHGASVGSHAITASITADLPGPGWRGSFRMEIIGPDGRGQASVQGTVTATPIAAGAEGA